MRTMMVRRESLQRVQQSPLEGFGESPLCHDVPAAALERVASLLLGAAVGRVEEERE